MRTAASIRSCGSVGPPSSGNGRIDGIVGTADAGSSPLRSNASIAASSSPFSGSFSSQIPIPSSPAAV